MAIPVSFRWDEEFVRRVDEARGDVPRSRFVRRAVEAQLTPTGPLEQVQDQRAFIPLTEEALVAAEQALGDSPKGDNPQVSAPAPAEHPRDEPYVPPFDVLPVEPAPAVCPRHPDAGFTRVKGSSKLWCAEPGCSASFEGKA